MVSEERILVGSWFSTNLNHQDTVVEVDVGLRIVKNIQQHGFLLTALFQGKKKLIWEMQCHESKVLF